MTVVELFACVELRTRLVNFGTRRTFCTDSFPSIRWLHSTHFSNIKRLMTVTDRQRTLYNQQHICPKTLIVNNVKQRLFRLELHLRIVSKTDEKPLVLKPKQLLLLSVWMLRSMKLLAVVFVLSPSETLHYNHNGAFLTAGVATVD